MYDYHVARSYTKAQKTPHFFTSPNLGEENQRKAAKGVIVFTTCGPEVRESDQEPSTDPPTPATRHFLIDRHAGVCLGSVGKERQDPGAVQSDEVWMIYAVLC